MPEALFEASEEYYHEFGFRSLQEFILHLVREKVVLDNLERYRQIEERMKKGKGVKKLDQKRAVRYLKSL